MPRASYAAERFIMTTRNVSKRVAADIAFNAARLAVRDAYTVRTSQVQADYKAGMSAAYAARTRAYIEAEREEAATDQAKQTAEAAERDV